MSSYDAIYIWGIPYHFGHCVPNIRYIFRQLFCMLVGIYSQWDIFCERYLSCIISTKYMGLCFHVGVHIACVRRLLYAIPV